jgi:tRNA U34 2-thiouridine synthase MnmA/TrmU
MSGTREPIKAVGLLSGGLDSTLAARLMLEEGIEVHAVTFTHPFDERKGSAVDVAVSQLDGIPLERIAMDEDFLTLVRAPRHGHGSALNPCIDCRIMTLRRAAERMRAIGARFLFTGEVLGQRPMSQHRRALDIIDSESGLAGSILRPLSAALLPPTVPETEGWVRRDRLLELRGRTRKPQMALAKQFGISDYPTPAGGCLLTDKHFAARLRDYFAHAAEPRMRDMPLLTVGKHFRLAGGDKAVVARNQAEGERLSRLARPEDHLLEPQFSGPVTVLQGTAVDDAVKLLLQHCRKELPPKAVVTHAWQGHTEELPVSREVGGTTVTAQKVEAQSVW